MSISTETNDQATDEALGMSDEEFASMDPSVFEQADDQVATGGEEDPTDDSEGGAEEDTDTTEEDDQDSDEEDAGASAEADDDQEEPDTEEDEDTGETDEDTTEEDDSEEGEADETDDKDSEENEKDKDGKDKVDYKAEYDRLLAPFKANGKELQVQNVDEAIQLMQMGANYNKKMAALKPSLKTLKTLEKNGLMDEQRLGYLIDLTKGNKGAIQKLLKDSGVDPLDLDTSEESDYKPNTYTADDREVELDSVLEDLQDTPTYNKTLDVVSNKWDSASQQIVANNPQLLNVINDHMASGIYERVSREVEKARTFGRLNGVSDIEAYKQIGDRLNEQGAFNDLTPNTGNQEGQAPREKKVIQPKRKRRDDSAIKAKKRAASSTKPKPAKTQPEFNPLALSDDEFEKQFNEQFL